MGEKTKKEIRCNQCGCVVRASNKTTTKDFFEGKKEWGFFSKKDLEIHSFFLCEDCYDQIVAGFRIPLDKKMKSEVM